MEEINDKQLKRELSFDLYGRYAAIRDIININRKTGESFRILDVGGRGNLLRKFLPNDKVFYLDPFIDSDDENFIKGDGCEMPLEDESFDWVASADVFEHIPKEKREDFLKENLRITKKGAILVAPFYTRGVFQAETAANENYKVLSGGIDHVWLLEHIENGLPTEKMVESFLQAKGIVFQKFSNNNLFLWELLISISLNEGYQSMEEFQLLNDFYNTEIYPFDSGEPGYRRVFFMKKEKSLLDLPVFEKKLNSYMFLQVIKMALSIINVGTIKNSTLLNQLQNEVKNLSVTNQEKDQVILRLSPSFEKTTEKLMPGEELCQENKNLYEMIRQRDKEIRFIRSSKFWKLREKYLKLKNKIRLQYED